MVLPRPERRSRSEVLARRVSEGFCLATLIPRLRVGLITALLSGRGNIDANEARLEVVNADGASVPSPFVSPVGRPQASAVRLRYSSVRIRHTNLAGCCHRSVGFAVPARETL